MTGNTVHDRPGFSPRIESEIVIRDMAGPDERPNTGKRPVPQGPHSPVTDPAPAGAVANRSNSLRAGQRNLPTWRRIEALREKRALKAALTDIWSDDPEVDEVLFGPDYDVGFYISPDEVDEETLLREAGFKPDRS